MPYIPDLTQGGATDHDLRPFCKGLVPRRKKGSDEIRWAMVLTWDLASSIERLTLPPKFRHELKPMRASFADPEGEGVTRKITPRKTIEVDLATHVGVELLGMVRAKAVLESFELKASHGRASAKAILTVITTEKQAEGMLCLLGSDVKVTVLAAELIPFPERELEEDEDDGYPVDPAVTAAEGDEFPPEPEPKPRGRKASLITADATV